MTSMCHVCLLIHRLAFHYSRNLTEADERNENLLFLNLEISSKQNTASDNITTGSTLRGVKKIVNLPQFSFSSISAATDNFSPANKLGEGGFGPVYKVILCL